MLKMKMFTAIVYIFPSNENAKKYNALAKKLEEKISKWQEDGKYDIKSVEIGPLEDTFHRDYSGRTVTVLYK